MSDADLESLQWLERFARRRGRPLRVLHIGNIANNAYNNARIQRAHGIDADAVCYGYYHVTGTPEWEDADLAGAIDPALPDWWAVDLGDWRRPDWFVQGPLLACLGYLRCRHAGRERKAARVRAALILAYWELLADAAARAGGQRVGHPFSGTALATSRKLGYVGTGVSGPARAAATIRARLTASGSEAALHRHKARVLADVIGPTLRRAHEGRRLSAVDRVILALYARHRRGTGRPPLPRLDAAAARCEPWRRIHSALAGGWGLAWSGLTRRLQGPTELFREPQDLHERAERFAKLYRERLPDAPEQDVERDTLSAGGLAGPWADVLTHYDIVQGYATDGVIPLYHGLANFTAYEHGTIRQIPFEDDTRGRLCNLTYRCAPRIFVTNTDVLPSVARLRIPAERVVCLPHAFDDKRLRAFRAAHPHLEPPAGPPVFLSPTRHHWARGDRSWLKGNDVCLRAAGRLAGAGRAFRVVLVEWGEQVDESKALIAELGIAHLVAWVPLMSKRALWATYCRSHAVIDQFAIPALGGVGFEALALGRRLITRVDEATLAKFFGACPPVLNGATVDEVERAMRRVLDDPRDLAGIGVAGSAWIETYHSAERIVALQARAYRDLVGADAGGA